MALIVLKKKSFKNHFLKKILSGYILEFHTFFKVEDKKEDGDKEAEVKEVLKDEKPAEEAVAAPAEEKKEVQEKTEEAPAAPEEPAPAVPTTDDASEEKTIEKTDEETKEPDTEAAAKEE